MSIHYYALVLLVTTFIEELWLTHVIVKRGKNTAPGVRFVACSGVVIELSQEYGEGALIGCLTVDIVNHYTRFSFDRSKRADYLLIIPSGGRNLRDIKRKGVTSNFANF